MKKKLLVAAALLLVVAVLAVVLVACQAGSQDQQEPQNMRQEVQQTEQPAITPEPTPGATSEPTQEPAPDETTWEDCLIPMFASEKINVYAAPDTSSDIFGQVEKDTLIIVLGISSDGIWARTSDIVPADGVVDYEYVLFSQLITSEEFDQQQQSQPSQQPQNNQGNSDNNDTQQQPQAGGSGGSGGSPNGPTLSTPEEREEAARWAAEKAREDMIAHGIDPDAPPKTGDIDIGSVWID